MANLPYPRDLRMASEHDTDLPMALMTGFMHPENAPRYTGDSVSIPMPLASSSSTPQFQVHSPLQPTQCLSDLFTPTPSRSTNTAPKALS